MKSFRQILFTVALLVIIVCVGLLVTNFDPTNPTHRRYSSEPVLITGKANPIGLSGEEVLSKDLDLPNNNKQKPRLAVCNTRYQNEAPPPNTGCIAYSDAIENYRIPDFVADSLIAESKNAQRLLTTYERDYQQIREIADGAKLLARPLWLYVRHNTVVDDAFHKVVEATGGRVVYYFATPNYVSPFDVNLLLAITVSLAVMVVVMLWETVAGFFVWMPTSRKPVSSIVVPEHKSSRKARQSVDDYERFMRDAGDHARKTLDD